VFFVLIAVEVVYARAKRQDVYRLNSSLSNLGCGAFTTTFEYFIKGLLLVGYAWIQQRVGLVEIHASHWLSWLAALLTFDFLWYWAHRVSHEVNFLWGGHEPHHQSADFNLTAGLRQGAFQDVSYWPFYLVMAVVGFPVELFVAAFMINKFYGFILHTQTVGTLPWVEGILSTPSAHRVHHGMNDLYLDRNHGGILMLWDRIFGTYQRETEIVVYGVRHPYDSFDPVGAHTFWLRQLWRDARATTSLKDSLRIWFMPTGWRPPDLAELPSGTLETLDGYRAWRPHSDRRSLWIAGAAFLLAATLNISLFTLDLSAPTALAVVVGTAATLYAMGVVLNRGLRY
jgi:sterol desaturase/sphingolipid hydroxylase (fatty acid hydroxylase superfamily)